MRVESEQQPVTHNQVSLIEWMHSDCSSVVGVAAWFSY